VNKIDFKILVLDDEPIMRDFLADILCDQGFPVEKLSHGKEILKTLEDKNVALVLTDLRMPDSDGLQVLKTIKSKNPKVKVILMTGYALDNSGQEYLDRGAFGFILKPFDINQIRDLVLDAYEVTVSEQARNLKSNPMQNPET